MCTPPPPPPNTPTPQQLLLLKFWVTGSSAATLIISVIIKMHINACFGKHSPAFAGFESLKTIQAYRQECKIFLAHWYLQMKGYIYDDRACRS